MKEGKNGGRWKEIREKNETFKWTDTLGSIRAKQSSSSKLRTR
jgi:hypothetical protein